MSYEPEKRLLSNNNFDLIENYRLFFALDFACI